MHIRRLQLHTPHLQLMQRFYTQVLGFPLQHAAPQGFAVRAGRSLLEFSESSGREQYHFAFNIPLDAVPDALEWLRQRVEVLPREGSEIVEFRNWNARAVYFRDPSGNILEFIGRQAVHARWPFAFGPEAVLSVSEAGVVSAFPQAVAEMLMQAGTPVYWGTDADFRAMGDPDGLFILVGAEWTWTPVEAPVRLSAMAVEWEQEGRLMTLRVDGEGQVILRQPTVG